MLKTLHKLINDLFTGPDGQTYAIGRVYSVLVLTVGLIFPFFMILHGQTVTVTDFGVSLGATSAAILALVSGTNMTEPKGIMGNKTNDGQ